MRKDPEQNDCMDLENMKNHGVWIFILFLGEQYRMLYVLVMKCVVFFYKIL